MAASTSNAQQTLPEASLKASGTSGAVSQPSAKQPSQINLKGFDQTINGTERTTIVISSANPEPFLGKLAANAPSIVLSLVALWISIKSFSYNRRRDRRSREQSIQDDFWIRKIISPISVEPFLKWTTELSAALPSAAGTTKKKVKAFWAAQALKITEYSLSFRTFGLVDKDLDSALEGEFERFDDCFTVYCGNLMQYQSGALPAPPDRDECIRTLIEITLAMLKLIRSHQAAMGRTEPLQ
jgi:hypothetical protein